MGEDFEMMRRAIELAKLGRGLTAPNPPVGAVIVSKGQIIGEGWHKRAGFPHAEREAIADAKARGFGNLLQDSTIYVTLEPCSTYGRTPPCCNGIIEEGISRVVYGSVDPNPSHQGGVDLIFQRENIAVLPGILKEECDALIRPFACTQIKNRPWIVAKIATSLDGRITRPPGESQWLSGIEALNWVQKLRFQSDAILTGGNTARIDNPRLTIRELDLPEGKLQPLKVIVTRNAGSLPSTLHVFDDPSRVFVAENSDFRELFVKLFQENGVQQLLVEAGGRLLSELLQGGWIDEWFQVLTPRLCGGGDLAVSGGFLPKSLELEKWEISPIGGDYLIHGILKNEN